MRVYEGICFLFWVMYMVYYIYYNTQIFIYYIYLLYYMVYTIYTQERCKRIHNIEHSDNYEVLGTGYIGYILKGKTEQMEEKKMGKGHKGNRVVVVPEQALQSEDTGLVAQETQLDIEETTTQEVVTEKKLSNVKWIIEELKKSKDLDGILKRMLEYKTEYKNREKGDKILMKQIKDIRTGIEEDDKRFTGIEKHGYKLCVDKETGLVREKTQTEIEQEKQKLGK